MTKFMDRGAFCEVTRLGEEKATEGTVLQKQWGDVVIKNIDTSKRTIEFIISTEAVDRMGDVIYADGWDLKNYKKNPVVLFAHDSSQPPIARALKVKAKDGSLLSVAEFMPSDMYDFSHMMFRMYAEGYMRAVSVGFVPKQYKFVEDDDSRPYGIDFLEQELLEYSAVPIPANPEALVGAKSSGIDLKPLAGWSADVLDGWGGNKNLFGLRKGLIESIYKQSTGKEVFSMASAKTFNDANKGEEILKDNKVAWLTAGEVKLWLLHSGLSDEEKEFIDIFLDANSPEGNDFDLEAYKQITGVYLAGEANLDEVKGFLEDASVGSRATKTLLKQVEVIKAEMEDDEDEEEEEASKQSGEVVGEGVDEEEAKQSDVSEDEDGEGEEESTQSDEIVEEGVDEEEAKQSDEEEDTDKAVDGLYEKLFDSLNMLAARKNSLDAKTLRAVNLLFMECSAALEESGEVGKGDTSLDNSISSVYSGSQNVSEEEDEDDTFMKGVLEVLPEVLPAAIKTAVNKYVDERRGKL